MLQLNRYFDVNKPWVLAKDPQGVVIINETHRTYQLSFAETAQTQLNSVIYHTLESLRVCGILLQPVMPGSMESLLRRLSVLDDSRTASHAVFGQHVGGHPLGPSTGHLFRKF